MDRELERDADREPPDNDIDFRTLAAGVDDFGLVLLDPAGLVRSWNAGAERITGYPAAHMVGRSIAILHAPDASAGDARPPGLETAAAEGRWQDRGWRWKQDGSRFWAEVTVTHLRGEDPAAPPRGFALVFRDLTESARREDEAREESRRLADAARHKDELLSLLVHQLRNPLAPIRNSLHLLKRGPADPRLASDLYDLMDRQVDRIARLVEDVLEISRLSRGAISLEPQLVDLRQVAHQALEARLADAERAGVALVSSHPPTPVWVRAEAARLRRVADALLDNALKHTGRGGSVTVEIADLPGQDRAELGVRDTGMGLAPDVLDRLRRSLAEPDASLDRARGGLGMGLALARGIVELHGGSIHASSAGAGRGAQFVAEFPRAEKAIPPTADRPAGPARAGLRLRILVVEDNVDAAESLRRLLNLHGHEVSVADNGVDGVAEAKRCHPDCVVCDIGLPGMDGYAVASALRRDPETARARLIAVTGYGRAEDRARALSSGFDDHIVKPADPEVLLSKLALADKK